MTLTLGSCQMVDLPSTMELRGAEFSYETFTLGPVDWSVGAETRCALVGPNGAGKTTLLNMLAGQQSPSRGSILINGRDVSSNAIVVREAVGLVPERLLCCPWLTASEHFELQGSFFPAWDRALARDLASRLKLDLSVKLGQLSRGTSLKVSLCSALAQGAGLLLLDEPTAGLDPVARMEFLTLLSEMLTDRRGLSVVFATHILEDLDELKPDEMLLLRAGQASLHPVLADTLLRPSDIARRELQKCQ